ncbi:hypothetical protein DFP91_0611 [Pseudorhodoplanes sinuspersici]|uniref:Uncharacterized protein n=1 Tax=Pseudorhodoplanes sinuspersici TaxID=1235591 RepID=A0A1W6ZVD8_9HYPH|nr:hypothetical protein CAK95_19820 [Pseudorhodoplanes sinuspersici]RKE72739.1 hypothetical protein DFP91_0611 [Pseudorhodoplanes sinuspersici]
MFKSPLLRKITFELFPAALLSFTGSILVAQYFRPAVVITPPSTEASVREDLIRTLQQERAILLDQMARIATRAASAHPANPETGQTLQPKGTGHSSAPSAFQPNPQTRTSGATPQVDDVKRQAKTRADASRLDASLPAVASSIQPPIMIVPVALERADNDGISPFDVIARPLEKTALWLKALKSKIAHRFSVGSTNDTQRFPGHGIY